MSLVVVLDASEIYDLGVRLQKESVDVVQTEIGRGLLKSGQAVQKHARRNLEAIDAIDTRRLYDSIQPVVRTTRVTIGSPLVYAQVIERGRGAGTWVPSGALLGWMGRKEIPLYLEYAIRRAIYQRGFAPRPYLVPAVAQAKDEIEKIFKLENSLIFLELFSRRSGAGYRIRTASARAPST